MANEFIARKGLIALDDTQITGSLGVSSTLSIPGFTNVSASLAAASGGSGDGFPFTGSAGISGSLELIGSGSTLFNIVGSEGTLFSITDSLSGSLFAVSDVSGLPILEVFSDNTVKIGPFNNEAITVSGSHTTIGGVLAIPGFSDVSASLASATAGGGTITGVTAGDGLTGGGSAGTVTLNVVGGTGITANANDIAVDATIATVIQLNASSSTLQSNIDGKQATLTFGKSSGNALKSEEALTTNDVLLMGSSNVKGRTYTQFRSDINVEDGADVTDTTNVTAAGALMDSELSDLASVKAINQGLTTTSNVTFANITSSGNISASGKVTSNTLDVDGFISLGGVDSVINNSGTITFGNISNVTQIRSSEAISIQAITTANITASSNISSSGTGSFAHLNLPGFNFDSEASTTELIVEGSISSSGAITGSDLNITGFPSVSASLVAASVGGSSAYHTWIGGKGQNTSQATFGTQWRGGMSGNALGGSFVVNADTSIMTVSSGTPTAGDTITANNYKIITALIHPAMAFTTIEWYGHLRAYNSACDGEDQHMEIWTLDDVNDLVGFGTTTLTFRGGNQWTYDGTSSTIKPIITSGSISHTGTDTTAFVVVSHVPTNPGSSMQFVYKFDFTVT